MPEYRVTFARSAGKELERLRPPTIGRVFRAIEQLRHEPRPGGCVKLTGEGTLWRLRVGDYRVIYSIDDPGRVVDIVMVRHRRDAYR
jgi:mRNA interferase RelE/StbE